MSKIERADRTAPAWLIQKLDTTLCAEGALIRLHQLDAARLLADVANVSAHKANRGDQVADGTSSSAFWPSEDIVVPARDLNGQVIFVSLSRRAFLQSVSSAAITGLTDIPAVAAQASTAAVLAAGPDPIEHFRELRRVLIDSDNMLGPHKVVPVVQEQIAVMQQLRRSTSGTNNRELMKIQTQYAELAGWLWQDLRNYQAAQYWTDRALEWAHLTQDRDLATYVLARKSQLAGDMSDGIAALDLAEAALHQATPRSRLAVVAATYAAHGHALLGDRNETQRAYDRANDLLAAMDPDPESAWGIWMDPAYLGAQRARSMTVLGAYKTAAVGFENALMALPQGYRRDRGVYLARQAVAAAGSHEAEHAAHLGLQALWIGTATASGRILNELTTVEESLGKWGDTSAVREFRSVMRETIGRQV